MLTKEQILAAEDLSTKTITVPEWGGDVVIKELTGAQKDAFEQTTFTRNGKNYEVNLTDMRARLCAISIVDDDGRRMFSDREIKALGGKSAKALERVFSACQSLNGMTNDEIDEMSKNSLPVQSDDLPSD